MRGGGRQRVLICALLTALAGAVANAAPPPAISIVIDDLGERDSAGRRALALPGAVAYSFLPGTMFAAAQARRAHDEGREVLLHLPLAPFAPRLYPMGIRASDGGTEVAARLEAALATVPYARGVNNHQGSALTASRPHMAWLMAEMRRHGGLYFVDSRTSARSVAFDTARAYGVPATSRQVFLDVDPAEAAVRTQWQRLIAIARRRGAALAIGHPNPATLTVLEQELPRLPAAGVRLVPPSALIHLQGNDRPLPLPVQLTPGFALATTAKAPPPPATR